MRPNVVGRMGLLSLQKCTATICILTYESPTNCVDEDANEIFGQEYLRRPNNNDINHLLQIGDSQYRRSDHRKPTIILEVVVSQDFSNNGPKNDINVVNQSHVFNDILQDDIYLDWTIFVKTIPMPQGQRRKLFVKCQEVTRKDAKQTFDMLKF
ncbi:hypothetical protein GmHk_20G058093 [Glycine max]|nr:hypothetical protein GmHk_20G058093 [Glycine max]